MSIDNPKDLTEARRLIAQLRARIHELENPAQKSWTYDEITNAAIERINSLMALKISEPKHHLAYGIYLGWRSLTIGWQNVGDDERIASLTKRENK